MSRRSRRGRRACRRRLHLCVRQGPEELGEIVAPYFRMRMRAVTEGVTAGGNEYVPPVLHARHQLLHEAELRRIHEIVRGVDGEHRDGDVLEMRRWIIE